MKTMCKINKWQYLPHDLWCLKWKALGVSSRLNALRLALGIQTSLEDFGILRKTSNFFGNLWKWSCHLQNSQHSQDKNLTPTSQKKLAGIELCGFYSLVLNWICFLRKSYFFIRVDKTTNNNAFCIGLNWVTGADQNLGIEFLMRSYKQGYRKSHTGILSTNKVRDFGSGPYTPTQVFWKYPTLEEGHLRESVQIYSWSFILDAVILPYKQNKKILG